MFSDCLLSPGSAPTGCVAVFYVWLLAHWESLCFLLVILPFSVVPSHGTEVLPASPGPKKVAMGLVERPRRGSKDQVTQPLAEKSVLVNVYEIVNKVSLNRNTHGITVTSG